MPLNRDDIIGETTQSVQRGITCRSIAIDIDPTTRVLRIRFDLSSITVLPDGKVYQDNLMPMEVDCTNGATTYDMYNRRTGVKSGATATLDQLSNRLMSLFFDTYAKNPPAG